MNILLAFPGFIVAFIILFYYESKIRKSRNNVRFYVVCEAGRYHKNLELWLGRSIWDEYHKFWKTNNHTAIRLGFEFNFRDYELNKNDFADMKEVRLERYF